jgi:hypothetical protein
MFTRLLFLVTAAHLQHSLTSFPMMYLCFVVFILAFTTPAFCLPTIDTDIVSRSHPDNILCCRDIRQPWEYVVLHGFDGPAKVM